MHKSNRIISTIVLAAFLLNTAFSDLALAQPIRFNKNGDTLAAALRTDDMMGPDLQERVRMRYAIKSQLAAATGNGSIEINDVGSLLKALAVYKDSKGSIDFSHYTSFYNEMREFGNSHWCLMGRFNTGRGQQRTYYAIFPKVAKVSAASEFPIDVYAEKEYKEYIKAHPARTKLPKRIQEESVAMYRYERHEAGLDKVIEFAHLYAIAGTPSPSELFTYVDIVNYLLTHLNIKVTNPDRAKLLDIQERSFSLIPLNDRVKGQIKDIIEKGGQRVTFVTPDGVIHGIALGEVREHASNKNINVFCDTATFDIMINPEKHSLAEHNRCVDEICRGIAHAIAIIVNSKVLEVRNGQPVTEIDKRYQEFLDKGKSNNLFNVPLEANIVDLDSNQAMLTRDYAAKGGTPEDIARSADEGSAQDKLVRKIRTLSNIVRKDILQTIFKPVTGHAGGSLSVAEILTTLYFSGVLKYDPIDPEWENRDRVVLSKGHAAPALYAVLAEAGFFPKSELEHLRESPDGTLQGHVDRLKTPGVDVSTGPLGQGFSNACGMAAAAKLLGKDLHVWSIIGGGEEQEGQISEAARHYASLGINNLTAIIDDNSYQIEGHRNKVDGATDVAAVWRGYGWKVIEVDGHDPVKLLYAMRNAKELSEINSKQPICIIAKTVKGKGVSYFEKDPTKSHGEVPKDPKIQAEALSEIDKAIGDYDPKAIEEFIKNARISAGEKAAIDKRNKANEPVFIESDETLKTLKPGDKQAIRTTGGEMLAYLGGKDRRIVCMSADLQPSVKMELFEKLFGRFSGESQGGRYFGLGIRESHGASFAQGMALMGLIPAIGTFDIFDLNMTPQIRNAIQNRAHVIYIGTHAGVGVGEDGTSHQGMETPGVMNMLSGPMGDKMEIWEPGDAEDARAIFPLAVEADKPVYIRETRQDLPVLDRSQAPADWKERLAEGSYILRDPGKGKNDLIIVATGGTVANADRTSKDFEKDGFKVKVINVVSINRIDNEGNPFQSYLEDGVPIVTVCDAYDKVLKGPVAVAVNEARKSGRSPGNIYSKGVTKLGSAKWETMYAINGIDAAGINGYLKDIIAKNRIKVKPSPLLKFKEIGQQIWLDGLTWEMIENGEFESLVKIHGITGVTTNPSLIKAYLKSPKVLEKIAALARQVKSRDDTYFEVVKELALAVIGVFNKCGVDGKFSVELNPKKGDNAEESVKEAMKWTDIDPDHMMVKVAANEAGYKIIEDVTAAGRNVNATLIFSPEQYRKVAEAYIRGLKRAYAAGKGLSKIYSVASFFISRWDVKFKDVIPAQYDGMFANAVAIHAYNKIFKELFDSEEFIILKKHGARIQDFLLASTGTKAGEFPQDRKDRYPQDVYVSPVQGDHIVNTLPLGTIKYLMTAVIRLLKTIEDNYQFAGKILDWARLKGINIETEGAALFEKGMESFTNDFNSIMNTITLTIFATVTGKELTSVLPPVGKYTVTEEGPDYYLILDETNTGGYLLRDFSAAAPVWKFTNFSGGTPHQDGAANDLLSRITITARQVQEGHTIWKIGDDKNYIEIANYGAALIRTVIDGREITWQAEDGKKVHQDNSRLAISGGIPLMLPCNGRTVEGKMITQDGTEVNVLISELARKDNTLLHLLHGFTDKVRWHTKRNDSTSITFSIKASEVDVNVEGAATLADIIGEAEFEQTYRMQNGKLSSELKVTNMSDKPLVLGGGYHPFYKVDNIEEWTIQIPANKVWSTDSTPLNIMARPDDIAKGSEFDYYSEPKRLKYGLELTLSGLTPNKGNMTEIILHNSKTGETRRITFNPKDMPNVMLWVPPENSPLPKGIFSVELLLTVPNGRNMHLKGNKDVSVLVLEKRGDSRTISWGLEVNKEAGTPRSVTTDDNIGFPLLGRNRAEDVKIMVIGTGGFIRTELVGMISTLNETGAYNGKVVIVQPRGTETAAYLSKVGGVYKIVTRNPDGTTAEQTINCVAGAGSLINEKTELALRPGETGRDAFMRYAGLHLDLIGIGVTEAGIQQKSQAMQDLTEFLYNIFAIHGASKMISVINTDNVPGNGDKIRAIVISLIKLNWSPNSPFQKWVESNVTFHNTMVDRIVDSPKEPSTPPYAEPVPHVRMAIEDLNGTLPVPLNKIQGVVIRTNKGEIDRDHQWKLRVLNALHTSQVYVAALSGLKFVRDSIGNPVIAKYLEKLAYSDMAPAVNWDIPVPGRDAKQFAKESLERFRNPNIAHDVRWIGQDAIFKAGVRLATTVKANKGKVTPEMAFAIASILRYVTPFDGGTTKDASGKIIYWGKNDPNTEQENAYMFGERENLRYIPDTLLKAPGKSYEDIVKMIHEILGRADLWNDINLAEYKGFTDNVADMYYRMVSGESALVVLGTLQDHYTSSGPVAGMDGVPNIESGVMHAPLSAVSEEGGIYPASTFRGTHEVPGANTERESVSKIGLPKTTLVGTEQVGTATDDGMPEDLSGNARLSSASSSVGMVSQGDDGAVTALLPTGEITTDQIFNVIALSNDLKRVRDENGGSFGVFNFRVAWDEVRESNSELNIPALPETDEGIIRILSRLTKEGLLMTSKSAVQASPEAAEHWALTPAGNNKIATVIGDMQMQHGFDSKVDRNTASQEMGNVQITPAIAFSVIAQSPMMADVMAGDNGLFSPYHFLAAYEQLRNEYPALELPMISRATDDDITKLLHTFPMEYDLHQIAGPLSKFYFGGLGGVRLLDECRKYIKMAFAAGVEFSTRRYHLLMAEQFFADHDEFVQHRKRYSDRFDIDTISGMNPEGFMKNLLDKAGERGNESIALIPYNYLSTDQLDKITAKGIRFILTDVDKLAQMHSDKDAAFATFQKDTYAIMELVRSVDERAVPGTPIYDLLSYYISRHFGSDSKITADAYINAIIKNDIQKLILAYLSYRPIEKHGEPVYEHVAAALLSA